MYFSAVAWWSKKVVVTKKVVKALRCVLLVVVRYFRFLFRFVTESAVPAPSLLFVFVTFDVFLVTPLMTFIEFISWFHEFSVTTNLRFLSSPSACWTRGASKNPNYCCFSWVTKIFKLAVRFWWIFCRIFLINFVDKFFEEIWTIVSFMVRVPMILFKVINNK